MAYTDIDDPSAHFQVHTFTKSSGSGSTTFGGNSDLKPDWLWTKSRSNADSHEVWDSTRGVSATMFMDNVEVEDASDGRLSSFNTDGYSWGTAGNHNAAGNMVAWAWKANGGTTSTNTDGQITSTVQANTTAGFSIVTFTTDGTTKTVGHGLGVKPDIVIFKSRNAAGGWLLITDVIDGSMDYNYVSGTTAFSSISYNAPTSSVFEYNDNNNNTQVAYCFAQKQGYSKFGSYTGNGNANGPFVHTGFKPAWVMVKPNAGGTNWALVDHKRSPLNEVDKWIWPDDSSAEYDGSGISLDIDFLSNGFKLRTSRTEINGNGTDYLYMAFAENPFVTSGGAPATAR